IAVALEFTGPLGLAMIASRKPIDFLWIALAGAGVVLLLPVTPLSTALDPRGVALALVAGFCWALYIVFGTKAGANGRAQASSLGMLVAAIVGAPLGLVTVGTGLLVPSVLGLGLAVALLSSAIPYSLEMAAMGRLPTRTFGILMSLEPAVAAITGLTILGEHLALVQWTAIGAVIAASAGSAVTSRTAEPAPN
ncbi:EamA family transporter, partial [Sphingomonas sp.]|uniref:EamA family transporter n=1 Tax=Sphingomonas sp. TaxID=28214 RepID=UPI0037513DDA